MGGTDWVLKTKTEGRTGDVQSGTGALHFIHQKRAKKEPTPTIPKVKSKSHYQGEEEKDQGGDSLMKEFYNNVGNQWNVRRPSQSNQEWVTGLSVDECKRAI